MGQALDEHGNVKWHKLISLDNVLGGNTSELSPMSRVCKFRKLPTELGNFHFFSIPHNLKYLK
ncbi:hypothetical protein TIFTF001_025428 [Ficus carica]|uniref:Uncharacterized protein n=1 Tax=Ficus carica TaxID=3494 RepID=A0AA88AP58_FICCA|nr:hypothetical protein TIFTF001_025428 [Ficus carica]